MNKYIKGILACGLSALIFTGCSQSSEELLAAPKSTITQENIKDIVREEIGDNVKLITPNNMMSSIMKVDMDGDGDEEVVLFYNNNDKYIGIAIIDEVNNKETVKQNFKIAGSNFEKVYIRDINGDKKKELLVGSSYGETMPKVINIYTLADDKYQDVYANSYEEVYVDDLDNDNIDEVILIDKNETDFLQYLSIYRLVNKELKFIVKSEVDYGTVNQLEYAKVSKDTKGIIVNSIVGAHAGSTNLLLFENNKLRQPIAEDDSNWDLLWNPYAAKCSDIDNDGIIEFPQMLPLKGYDDAPMSDVRYMKQWSKWDGKKGLVSVVQTIGNFNMSYELSFKKNINSNMTVREEAGTNITSDVYYEIKGDKKTDIFKITLLNKKDATKKMIKTKGDRFYYLEVLNEKLFKEYGYDEALIRENLNAM